MRPRFLTKPSNICNTPVMRILFIKILRLRFKNIPQAKSRLRMLNDNHEIKVTNNVKLTQILKGMFCTTSTTVFLLRDTNNQQLQLFQNNFLLIKVIRLR